jgi:hypothetical protein
MMAKIKALPWWGRALVWSAIFVALPFVAVRQCWRAMKRRTWAGRIYLNHSPHGSR